MMVMCDNDNFVAWNTADVPSDALHMCEEMLAAGIEDTSRPVAPGTGPHSAALQPLVSILLLDLNEAPLGCCGLAYSLRRHPERASEEKKRGKTILQWIPDAVEVAAWRVHGGQRAEPPSLRRARIKPRGVLFCGA